MILAIVIILAILVLPSPLGLIAVGVAAVIEVGEVVLWKTWMSRYSVKSGPETLVGSIATVVQDCSPEGRARVRGGEVWNARSSAPLAAGAQARVAAVDGLVLDLEPDGDQPA